MLRRLGALSGEHPARLDLCPCREFLRGRTKRALCSRQSLGWRVRLPCLALCVAATHDGHPDLCCSWYCVRALGLLLGGNSALCAGATPGARAARGGPVRLHTRNAKRRRGCGLSRNTLQVIDLQRGAQAGIAQGTSSMPELVGLSDEVAHDALAVALFVVELSLVGVF